MGDQIAVAVVGELAFVVDRPEHFKGRVVGGRGKLVSRGFSFSHRF